MIQISPNTKDLIITLSNLYFYNCISAIKTQSVQGLYLSNFTVTNSNSSSYAALQFSYSLLKFLKQKSSPHQFFEAGKEFSVIVCGLNERILCAREIFHLVTPLK